MSGRERVRGVRVASAQSVAEPHRMSAAPANKP